MIVYCRHIGPRLSFVTSEIARRMKIPAMRITTDRNEFLHYSGARINYSDERIENALQIVPSGFLEENTIRKFEPGYFIENYIPFFFPTEKQEDFSFDLFSSVFYLLSRYEEHLPFSADQHGRFTSTSTILNKLNVIDKPVAEYQISKFHQLVEKKFPGAHSLVSDAKMIVTVDIDNAWAYQNKSFAVRAGQFFRDLLRLDFARMNERRSVRRGRKKDPYDQYQFINEALQNAKVDARFFFLLADRSRFDRNIAHTEPALVDLIKNTKNNFPVGIHPGYASHLSWEKLHKEVTRLQQIIQEPVRYSRFHYLRFCLPESYRNMERAGVWEEHSMGFADHAGFRAGTCFPFQYYDLEQERTTSLCIIPMVIMDGTLKEYMNMNPDQAMHYSTEIWNEVRKFGGSVSVLWHNETLSDQGNWKGWRNVFLHHLSLSRNSG